MTEALPRPSSVEPGPVEPGPVEPGHVEPLFVHFDDLDSIGMVHNTRYPVLVERALTMYWHRLGYDYRNGSTGHPDASVIVAEFAIKYRMPIRGTGEIGVHFWTERIGTTSVVYGYRIRSADGATVHAEGNRVHIRFDVAAGRPTAWLDETRAVYQKLHLG